MNSIPDNIKEDLEGIKTSIKDRLDTIKNEAHKDTNIDEFELDKALLDTPKLYSKWLEYHTEETINLKDLYSFKEKVKLERWKYYMGKQDSKYYHLYGQVHEKILKTDVEKYLMADVKIIMVNDIVTVQKALTDFIEKTLKEISNRGFHIKSIIEYRKFINAS